MKRCNQNYCEEPVRGDDHYICEVHWEDLCGRVSRVIDRASVAYIGRSYDPDERLRAHEVERGLDRVKTVYAARSGPEAKAIEEALIRRFSRVSWRKLDNKSMTSDGSIRGGRNYVYVAFVR